MILAEGGLGTKWKEIRPALPAAVLLSLVGVGISVGVTAAGAHYLVGLEWRQALIIGAVVSSTDAAAVFSVLRKVPLPARVTGVLEAESGFNDAPVVILVVAFSTIGEVDSWYVLIGEIALELAIGAAVGIAVGWLGSYGLRHVALPASGLYPIAVMAIAVSAYAAGAMLHGSGFLAVYLAAMILGNAKLPHWPATRGFADGLGWLAQIGMFVLLGLLVTPHDLLDDFWPAVVVGLVLTVVARPLEVFISLLPFRLPWQEKALMSWAGLRGAVPIILATIPMVSGIDGSTRVFNIVFVLVIVYTLIQGPTLPGSPRPSTSRTTRPKRPTWASNRHPWNGCADTCCRWPSPRSRRCTASRSASSACPRAPRSPSWCATTRASYPPRRRCSGAATNCSSWPPTRCATRPGTAARRRRGRQAGRLARNTRRAARRDGVPGAPGGRSAQSGEEARRQGRRGQETQREGTSLSTHSVHRRRGAGRTQSQALRPSCL